MFRVSRRSPSFALVAHGHRPLPLEAKPAEQTARAQGKAKLVGRLQDPMPEAAVYFDARRDDLVRAILEPSCLSLTIGSISLILGNL